MAVPVWVVVSSEMEADVLGLQGPALAPVERSPIATRAMRDLMEDMLRE
jgi:hypothetical protein